MGQRYYIAGPMTGYEDFNYPAFNHASNVLDIMGLSHINPAANFSGDQSLTWDTYLRQAVRQVAECTGLVLLDGWTESRGARLEALLAGGLGLRFYEIAFNDFGEPVLDEIPRGDIWSDIWRSTTYSSGEMNRGGWLAPAVVELGSDEGEAPADTLIPDTILEEAQSLVQGPRQGDYGHPIDDFTRTGAMWGALLGREAVDPHMVALMMVALKLSREVNRRKRDNRVDAAGYLLTADMVDERQAE